MVNSPGDPDGLALDALSQAIVSPVYGERVLLARPRANPTNLAKKESTHFDRKKSGSVSSVAISSFDSTICKRRYSCAELRRSGISASLQLTYGPASDDNYPEALKIIKISGTFSDTNNGLNIINAIVGPLQPVKQDAPELGNSAAPKDFSRFAVTTGLGPENNGFLTYDNLFWPNGSPPTASDYPLHGGILDIYGLMFGIGGGRVVDIWSNGDPAGTGVGPIYGAAVATSATALDYVGGVRSRRNPARLLCLVAGSPCLSFGDGKSGRDIRPTVAELKRLPLSKPRHSLLVGMSGFRRDEVSSPVRKDVVIQAAGGLSPPASQKDNYFFCKSSPAFFNLSPVSCAASLDLSATLSTASLLSFAVLSILSFTSSLSIATSCASLCLCRRHECWLPFHRLRICRERLFVPKRASRALPSPSRRSARIRGCPILNLTFVALRFVLRYSHSYQSSN